MWFAGLFIVDSYFNFIGFINRDFKVFIPSIGAGEVRTSTLSTFYLERDVGIGNLFRSRSEFPRSDNGGVVELSRAFNSNL
jgi:hypothetical protein